MAQRIQKDLERFHKLVRGKVKSNLGKYITRGEMIGKKGKDLVSIPLPRIDIPNFHYGQNGSGGVGQGEGDVGQPLNQPQQGNGEKGSGGDQPGGHVLETEISIDDMANLIGEELQLPRLEPKGKKNIVTEGNKVKPRHSKKNVRVLRKQTFLESLKRHLSTIDPGNYDPITNPPVRQREDLWTKDISPIELPVSQAAIIHMMDVSGSMTDEQKEIVRIESFWIDTWIKKYYKGVESAYIIHDATATEVDEHTYYHTRESGGTKISAAYELCDQIITKRYPTEEWNVYAFHFSDGDNWGDDTPRSLDIVQNKLLPKVNLFAYAQVNSPYGSGEFLEYVREALSGKENCRSSEITGREDILKSIKELLG